MTKKTVCITGATGTMGMATLREFASRLDRFDVIALARPGKKNERKLAEFPWLHIVWGDLLNADDVRAAAGVADYVLHIGGLVSPEADRNPRLTLKVNVGGAENVVRAVLEGSRPDTARVVYIGSVAQSGDRRPPHHWGRTGDPLMPAAGDGYALSKVRAELAIVDSGLKHWVCLRQTGILYPGLLLKGSDPIAFHVPLRGVLEWTTAEESGRLMANICEDSVPADFWNKFYNIGSGESYRLTNYEFEKMLMKALGCPPPQKCFRAEWFATRNFHGQWWADSDRLEELVPFRSGITAEEYFRSMTERVPFYFRLAPLAPGWLVRMGMKMVAKKKPLGTLYWCEAGDEEHIRLHFGSHAEMESIPGWTEQTPELERYPEGEPRGKRIHSPGPLLDHGYDERKPLSELNLADMRQKAAHEGGECLSDGMTAGDLASPLRWRCGRGHEFRASAAAVLLGGHWCPECLTERVATF